MSSPRTSQKLMSQHPLQRLTSPSRSISALIHISGIISFILSFRYLTIFPTVINDSYGWHYQYLTILGLSLTLLTFTLALLSDITLSPTLFLLKNSLSLICAPLEVLISLLYWGISAIDKSLLMPPEVRLDPLADIGFHLAPAVFLVLDLLLLSPPWTIHALPAMGVSAALAGGYYYWVEHCYSRNGFYPYPLMEQLDTAQRVMLFGGAAMLMTGSTIMLKWLYGRVNGLQGAQRRSNPANIQGKKLS